MEEKEFEKLPKKNNFFNILLLIIVVCIAFLSGYLLNSYSDKSDNNGEELKNETENQEELIETLDVESSEVAALFEPLNSFNSWDSLLDNKDRKVLFTYFYQQEKLLNTDVKETMKFAIAYDQLYSEEVKGFYSQNDEFRFYLNDLNRKSNEIFGTSINVNEIIYSDNMTNGMVTVYVKGTAFQYNSDDNSFSVSPAGVGDCSSGDYQTKIISAKKYNDRIEIINKVIFKYCGCNDNNLNIFKEASDNNDSYFGFTNKIDDVEEVVIDNYLDEADSFKWVFTKNDVGNYIFSSVEKIK